MTDQDIIKGLIERDEQVTSDFFYVSCKPLLLSVLRNVFHFSVSYDEMVNELYLFLMENDAEKLRSFQFRCSIYQWLKIVAIRFFLRMKDHGRAETTDYVDELDEDKTPPATTSDDTAVCDLNTLFVAMPNKRYVYVIRQLILEDRAPEDVAKEMNVTLLNLYNIKKRAMEQLASVALNDKKWYER